MPNRKTENRIAQKEQHGNKRTKILNKFRDRNKYTLISHITAKDQGEFPFKVFTKHLAQNYYFYNYGMLLFSKNPLDR